MIVTGGLEGPKSLSTVEKYDVDGNMVETLPSLKISRYHFSQTLHVGSVYIV